MTISLDPATAPLAVAGDTQMSTAALLLLLSQHAELVDEPIRWEVDAGTVRAVLPHRRPENLPAAQLLAAALELDLDVHEFTTKDGLPCASLLLAGRWGGTEWALSAYVDLEGGEQP